MTEPEVITAIKDIALAFAGVITAAVAVKGLGTWNRQLRGTVQFEVARSVARAAYKLRDALRACRSPWISGHEFPEEYHQGGMKKTPEQEAAGYAHVYSKRWAPVWDALQELDASTLEAEALWGAPIRQATDLLRKVVREVNVAIDAYISNAASGGADFADDREYAQDIRRTLWGSPTDAKNSINTQLADAISAIDDQVRPHLQRR
jgi:hypothetical protein